MRVDSLTTTQSVYYHTRIAHRTLVGFQSVQLKTPPYDPYNEAKSVRIVRKIGTVNRSDARKTAQRALDKAGLNHPASTIS